MQACIPGRGPVPCKRQKKGTVQIAIQTRRRIIRAPRKQAEASGYTRGLQMMYMWLKSFMIPPCRAETSTAAKERKKKNSKNAVLPVKNTEYLRITRKGAAAKKASPATEENKRYTHAQPTAARYRCRAAAPAAQKRRWQLQPDWRQPPMKKTHKKKEK